MAMVFLSLLAYALCPRERQFAADTPEFVVMFSAYSPFAGRRVARDDDAGVLGEFKPLAVTEADEFDALIATNLPPTETTGEHKVACSPLKFYQYIIYYNIY
ncbi:hypothetical protein [Rhizobium leguminosarum]|uniref:hypothetical protein n=1 Tax=Rhizobium leguminosarum TaxID=384 RepID=UPI003F944EC5